MIKTLLSLLFLLLGVVIGELFLLNEVDHHISTKTANNVSTPTTNLGNILSFNEKLTQIAEGKAGTNYIINIEEGIVKGMPTTVDVDKNIGDCVSVQLDGTGTTRKGCFFSNRNYYKVTKGKTEPSHFSAIKNGDHITTVDYQLLKSNDLQTIKTNIYFGDETTKEVQKTFH